jgi:hypothetical protein
MVTSNFFLVMAAARAVVRRTISRHIFSRYLCSLSCFPPYLSQFPAIMYHFPPQLSLPAISLNGKILKFDDLYQFRCRTRTVGRTDFILLLVLILLSHSFELIHIGALHACSLHKYYINNNCIPNYCIIK